MPRGENTILRENGKPEPIWPRLLKAQCNTRRLLQAQGTSRATFEADGHTYEICSGQTRHNTSAIASAN